MKSERKNEIWAIGGGKGGSGKTFITSSMATYLAKKDKRAILFDFDIGGANLNSFLGIDMPKRSLSSFFEKGAPLNELIERTGIPNLRLITGDIHSLTSDKIKYSQKLKLFRHVKILNSQYVLIDLGAGSHHNTLDAFLMADKKIAIIEPEVIAVENFYHFIKNALFRRIRISLRDYGFKEFIEHIWNIREKYKIKNLWDLIAWFKDSFSFIGDILDKELEEFKVYLIVNKVRNREDIYMGSFIKSAFKKYTNIQIKYVGYIEFDDSVWKAVRNRRPYMLRYVSSSCAQEIETLTKNLVNEEEVKLP